MKKYLHYFYRLAVLFTFLLSVITRGQGIFSNPITGINPNTNNPYTIGQVYDSNLMVSGIGRGSGISGVNANNRYNASGWNGLAMDVNDYFEFTLTPTPNFQINFNDFVYTGEASVTGPVSFAFRSSLDNFSSDIGTPPATGGTIDLSAVYFQNVKTPITFRIYAWGASGTSGTFSINDFIFNGTVSSTVIKPEPTNFPTSFSCSNVGSTSIQLSWADAIGTTAPDGYLIRWGSTSYNAIADPVDGIAVPNGTNAQSVLQGTQAFIAAGLMPSTGYYFKIWSYTNSGTNINYKLVGEPQTICTTLAPPCDFIEDFSNSNATSIYTSGSFVGNNSITWTYTEARNEGGFGINAKGIMFHDATSKITSSLITDGLSAFTCSLKKGFSSAGNRQVELFVNGVSVGRSAAWDNADVQTFSVNNINIPGSVTIELRNATNHQVVIDDLSWACYTGTAQPKINIQGNNKTIPAGSTTASTSDGTEFGSTVLAGTDVERTFTLQNMGSATLTLGSPPVSLINGTAGFSVSAQPFANALPAFSSQTFKIKFNNTVPGTHTETVKISSDDPATPIYTFTVKATVLTPGITVDKSDLSGLIYPLGQGPSARQSFVVNGTDLAGSIIVTASTNWEISSNQTYSGLNVAPWSTLTLNKSAGGKVTNKTVYVRLKDGLPVGIYSGSITLSSPSAATQTVNLSGEVTAGIPEIKVTGNGTRINNGSTSPSGLNNTLFATQNMGNSQTKPFEIKNMGGANLNMGNITVSGADAAAFTLQNGPAGGTVLTQNQSATFEIKFTPTSIGIKNAVVSITSNDPDDNPFTFTVRGGAVYCSSSGEIILAQQDFEVAPSPNELAYTVSNIGEIQPGPQSDFSSGNSGNNSAPKNNNLYSHGTRGYRVQGADPTDEKSSGLIMTFASVDTSAYTDVTLSYKVAGFSLGSNANGMDSRNNDSDPQNIADSDKIDHVLVEVSPDGGSTWYKQAKIVSDEMNLAWGFNSAGTGSGSRAYAANQNLTYFKSTSALKYSAVSITGLPQVPELRVRISLQNNAVNESWIVDDVRIVSTGLVPKVWNGTSWVPSPPQHSDRAVIEGDFVTGTHDTFRVCQCEVKNGAKIVISENTALTITDALKNDGEILVESDGGLVQLNDSNTNSGSGTFTAERKIKLSVPIPPQTDRNQYNYLISPVAGVNLKTGIYNGISAPMALYHNQATNFFAESSGAYIPGRALAVKEPSYSAVPSSVTQVKAVFRGEPVNGNSVSGVPLTFTAVNSSPGADSPSSAVRGYNLIGNPYPSNIDLVAFYNLNGGEAGGISSTFYFWDNNANNTYTQGGSGYSGNAYAQFNAVSLTPTKAFGEAGASTLKSPTRYVPMAQGFMTRVLTASKNLIFSNSIRKTDAATAFFGKNGAAINRFWLNMISPSNKASNIAVVYFEEGNNGYAADDSPVMGGSDVLFSLAGDRKVSINGRSAFGIDDVVKLGSVYYADGLYTIALDDAEGMFAENQNIYLKDNKTGSLTNLSEGTYTFYALAGESCGRFEIVYRPGGVLGTDVATKEGLAVYRDGDDLILKADTKKITGVEVYDPAGRLIHKAQSNSLLLIVPAEQLDTGVFILKINQGDKVTVRKITK